MRLGELVIDLSPLRAGRNFRLVLASRTATVLFIGITALAVNFQVYSLTRSSLHVALISLTLGAALIVGMVGGGLLADRFDRRSVIIVSSVAGVLTFVGMALNASSAAPALWPIYACAFFFGVTDGVCETALTAAAPTLVDIDQLPACGALLAVTAQLGAICGPLLGGLLIGTTTLDINYWITGGGMAAVAVLLAGLPALAPSRSPERMTTGGMVGEGMRFIARNQLVAGVLVIDLAAMLFAMPFALFPQFADEVFGGGVTTIGLLTAAPAAGGVIGSTLSGWTGRSRHSGRALIVVIICWGLAITGFGLSSSLPGALVFLGLAGAADTYSEILRRALLQANTPDHLQGRVSSLWLAQATASQPVGGLTLGLGARLLGPAMSVTVGGLLCVAGTIAVALAFPRLRAATLIRSDAETTSGAPAIDRPR